MRVLSIVSAAVALTFTSSQQPASGGFVILGGADTVVTQRFNREGRVLHGELKQMNLRELTSIVYTIEFARDTGVHRVTFTETTASRTAMLETQLGSTRATSKVTAPGQQDRSVTYNTHERAHPSAGIIIPLVEAMLRDTKPIIGQEHRLLAYNIRQLDTGTVTIRRPSRDSAMVTSGNLTMRLAVSNEFDVLGGVMIYPARTWTIKRVP